MKKLFIAITLILMISFTTTNEVEVNAGTTSSITWVDNSTIDAYVGTATLEEGITWLEIAFPNNYGDEYVVSVNAYTNFSVDFCTDTCTTPDISLFDSIIASTNIALPESSNVDLYQEIYIDYESYEIPDTVNIIEITLPYETYSSDYMTKLNNAPDVEYHFDPVPFGKFIYAITLDIDIDSDPYRNDYLISQYVEIPSGTTAVEFVSTLSRVVGTANDNGASLFYYDENKELVRFSEVVQETTSDWYVDPDGVGRVFSIPWSEYSYNITNEVKYIRVAYEIYNNGWPLSTASGMTDVYPYYIDGEHVTVNFYSNGEIIYTAYTGVGASTIYYDLYPTQEGKEFTGWIDSNGYQWNDGDSITNDMISNNIANIYAVFINIPDTYDTDVSPNTPQAGQFEVLLDDLGFNDSAERIVVFAFVMLLATIAMFAKKLPLFVVLVVDAIILVLFMTLGLLPTFVSIIITVVLLALLLYFVVGGVKNE